MAEKQKRPDETPSDKQTTITFANFLESVPPSQKRIVSGTIEATYAGDTHQLNLSDILIFCPSEECNGSRVFRYEGEKRYIRPKDNDFFIDYICSNCRKSHKLFALRVEGPSAQNLVVLYKYGEMPPFGPPTPPRLLRLLEDQKSLFIKGRRCEIQGLGVGAFGYYRRVVENQKNRILDEIIKVSERLGAQQPAFGQGDIVHFALGKERLGLSAGLVGTGMAFPIDVIQGLIKRRRNACEGPVDEGLE